MTPQRLPVSLSHSLLRARAPARTPMGRAYVEVRSIFGSTGAERRAQFGQGPWLSFSLSLSHTLSLPISVFRMLARASQNALLESIILGLKN